jgi:hypothetical protein
MGDIKKISEDYCEQLHGDELEKLGKNGKMGRKKCLLPSFTEKELGKLDNSTHEPNYMEVILNFLVAVF